MQNTTLLFLIKKENQVITDILLAQKKRGFGTGKYNGVGGKVEDGETVDAAAIRETKEEIGVDVLETQKVAELTFIYNHKPEWNQVVHIYFCEVWSSEPSESEEVAPSWFAVRDIPYTTMWPDDAIWLPKVLDGQKVDGQFVFEGDEIKECELGEL